MLRPARERVASPAESRFGEVGVAESVAARPPVVVEVRLTLPRKAA